MFHCFSMCHLSALIFYLSKKKKKKIICLNFCPDYDMEYKCDQATHTVLDWSPKSFAIGELATCFNVICFHFTHPCFLLLGWG
jgi:hypothetical protein